MSSRSRNRGITLIELMTTVSVASLTLVLGVPAFTGVQANMQRAQASMELIASFSLARSEAARRGAIVKICPSSDGRTCSTARPFDWGAGWIVLIDQDPNEILHVSRFPDSVFHLTSDNPAMADGVRFKSSGFLSPEEQGLFLYSDKTESRQLKLSAVGRLEQLPSASGRL